MTSPYSAPAPVDSTHTPRESLGALTLWRLMIAFCALYGLYGIIGIFGEINWNGLHELSQLASLIVGVTYIGLACYPIFTGGARHEPRSPWLRGALATLMLLVSLTSIFIFNGGRLFIPGFFFEHLVTPIVVVLDFLVIGASRSRVTWWYPLTWLSLPLAYLVFILSTGVTTYGGLFSPTNPDFVLIVLGFCLGVLVIGFALVGLASQFSQSAIQKSVAGQHPLPMSQQFNQWPDGQVPNQGAVPSTVPHQSAVDFGSQQPPYPRQ